jgi:Glycine-zipper domain
VRMPTVCVLCAAMLLSACANPRPVLYENSHLATVGKKAADHDIEACKEAAELAGAEQSSGATGRVAASTGVGAGVGAASGAVGGAISGAAGQGSLIGAATGAVWGLLMGLFNAGSSQPSQAYTNYVNRCLQEKGYEVVGWE